jgi:hypothetical protein
MECERIRSPRNVGIMLALISEQKEAPQFTLLQMALSGLQTANQDLDCLWNYNMEEVSFPERKILFATEHVLLIFLK